MTADELTPILREAGFLPIAQHATHLAADRDIPGHPLQDRRSIILQRFDPDGHAWVGACFYRRCVDPEALLYDNRCLNRSGLLRTPDEVGLWIGGVASIPCDKAEVEAIHAA